MNDMVKYLIIITLCYYLVKGLMYLILWQASKKMEQKARETRKKYKPTKFKRGKDGWYIDEDDDEE